MDLPMIYTYIYICVCICIYMYFFRTNTVYYICVADIVSSIDLGSLTDSTKCGLWNPIKWGSPHLKFLGILPEKCWNGCRILSSAPSQPTHPVGSLGRPARSTLAVSAAALNYLPCGRKKIGCLRHRNIPGRLEVTWTCPYKVRSSIYKWV